MSVSIYKLKFSKTLEPIKKSKWFYLGSIFLIILFGIFSNYIIATLVFSALVAIPIYIQIILHLNYYFHDKNLIIIIDYDRSSLTYKKKKRNREIFFSDIKLIKRYQGSKYPSGIARYTIPSNFYHYTSIVTKRGEEYKFSDFVKGEIEIFGLEKKKIIIPFFNIIR